MISFIINLSRCLRFTSLCAEVESLDGVGPREIDDEKKCSLCVGMFSSAKMRIILSVP